jgi:hypothetical protein
MDVQRAALGVPGRQDSSLRPLTSAARVRAGTMRAEPWATCRRIPRSTRSWRMPVTAWGAACWRSWLASSHDRPSLSRP